MPYEYSRPRDEGDLFRLPDVEIWLATEATTSLKKGFYWWYCFPGCMPEGDGDPFGPFTSYEEALNNAREMEE